MRRKLGVKLYAIMIVFIAVTFTAIWLVLTYVTASYYEQVQGDIHRHSMQNMYEIILSDYARIDTIVRDWSHWDATYEYVFEPNQAYIDENLPIETYEELGIRYIYIFNNKLEVLYSGGYNSETGLAEQPPDPLARELKMYQEETGFLLYNGQLYVYSTSGITDNSGILNSGGKMVHLYQLNESYFEEISRRMNQNIELYIAKTDQSLYDTSEMVIDGRMNPFGVDVLLEDRQGDSIGYLVIPIYNEQTNLYYKIILDNSVYELGEKSMTETVLLVLGVLSIFLILVGFMIRQIVVKRILLLSHEVAMVTTSENVKNRVTVVGDDEIGRLAGGVNSMLDKLDAMHTSVKEQATYDEMTGAYNRRAGYEKLEALIQSMAYDQISVVFIDINGLKQVNDTYGHKFGDQLIVDMVELISESKSGNDDLIRMGGDEFLLVLPGKDMTASKDFMDAMVETTYYLDQSDSVPYRLSFSYGIEAYESGMTVDELIENADKLMYEMKIRKHRQR